MNKFCAVKCNKNTSLCICMTHKYSFESQWSKLLAAVNASHFQFAKMHFAKKISKKNDFAQSVFAQPCELQNKNRGSFAK